MGTTSRYLIVTSKVVLFSLTPERKPKTSKMTLSDADVHKQIKHMMAFIEQEVNIEKGRLVQQQRLKIMEYYERKEKQVELQKKIQSSNLLNQARLRVLKARDEHVSNVLDDGKQQLANITRDKQKYSQLLQGLIVQGVCQLLEPKIFIRCREQDQELVQSVIPSAVASVKEMIKMETDVQLDTEGFLPANSAGGVELLAKQGKIKVNNSLEAR